MLTLARGWFGKLILTIIGITLVYSLIASGICEGPIDEIFIGWRDKTGCIYQSCIIGAQEQSANTGALAIAVFLVLVAIALKIMHLWDVWEDDGQEAD